MLLAFTLFYNLLTLLYILLYTLIHFLLICTLYLIPFLLLLQLTLFVIIELDFKNNRLLYMSINTFRIPVI